MKKKSLSLFLVLLILTVLSSCATSSGGQSAAGSTKPYHVMRTTQLKDISVGSIIGIVSASNSGSFGILMGAALEDKSLVVREMDLHSLLPPDHLSRTNLNNQYTFIDALVKDSIDIINNPIAIENGEVVRNVNLDLLIDKLLTVDDLVVENQRISHYLELVSSLKKMIETLNVDYVLVGGSPYLGLSYTTKIYDTKTLNIVFSNLIAADKTEWRRMVSVPTKSTNISFAYEVDDEPLPFWELTYCEMIASKINIK